MAQYAIREMKPKKGSILIITLWVLSILAIFAIGLARNASGQLRLSAHLQDRLKAYYLAQAGVERAILELEADANPDYDSLNENWANNEEFFKQIPLGDGYFTVSYSLQQAVQQESGQEQSQLTLYGVMDENSKININKVPVQILQTLLEQAAAVETEEAADIANAIMDWRDVDVITSPGGAEDNYYEHLDKPYSCKDGQLQVLQELLLVKGMTQEIYTQLEPFITIYGEGQVNINTVDAATLVALGLSSDLAQRIIEFRRGDDGMEGTEDDNIFKTVGEIRNIGSLFTNEAEQINRLTSLNVLSVKSNTFRINSTGIIKKGNRSLKNRIVCVVQRIVQKPSQIRYWHED
jgi:general secretion pathway protein K